MICPREILWIEIHILDQENIHFRVQFYVFID